ncbi:MAG: integrase, partial [Cellvibrionaceae bacterium]|nr:integrase [Cellvibrionaceae bacterium]
MARGGINKVLVKQARDALLSKGVNPSIDAVRAELGNTGSKTTIHRYLKELEYSEGARLDDETLLSSTLKEMVARLASQLKEEAQQVVTEAEERHKGELSGLQQLNDNQTMVITSTEKQLNNLEGQLAESQSLNKSLDTDLQAANAEVQRLEQQVADQKSMLIEKGSHIESLEEKHKHNREALEHYRQSVKEQRDQDQRKHEQQVQHLQTEQRQLNQSLSIKQTEITQLSKDNARLATELSEARKQLSSSESELRDSVNQLKNVERQSAERD